MGDMGTLYVAVLKSIGWPIFCFCSFLVGGFLGLLLGRHISSWET